MQLAYPLYVPNRYEFPAESAELDKLFKESGCTLTGGGYQDGMLADLILTLAANANNIRYYTVDFAIVIFA